MNQQTYYGGKNEFRWEYLPIGQGHYFLASNIQEAVSVAGANAQRDVVIVQQWKPARGQKYFIKPRTMLGWTTEDVARYYVSRGYDRTLIANALFGSTDVTGQVLGQSQKNPGYGGQYPEGYYTVEEERRLEKWAKRKAQEEYRRQHPGERRSQGNPGNPTSEWTWQDTGGGSGYWYNTRTGERRWAGRGDRPRGNPRPKTKCVVPGCPKPVATIVYVNNIPYKVCMSHYAQYQR